MEIDEEGSVIAGDSAMPGKALARASNSSVKELAANPHERLESLAVSPGVRTVRKCGGENNRAWSKKFQRALEPNSDH